MQNEKTLQQMIREYEAQMPPEIMNIIKNFDWKKEVRTIVNQNQLMIDVGADLEESIYMMLLGVTNAQDMYERLIEVHQVPEDKSRKILEEMEQLIFNPLYKKLTELPAQENSVSSEIKTSTTPRDEMLAEIEKEPEPLIKLNFAPKETVSTESVKPSSVEQTGITQPFSISKETNVVLEKKEISAAAPMPQAVEGVQQDPVASALTKPTVAQNPQATTKPYASDPYREPIE